VRLKLGVALALGVLVGSSFVGTSSAAVAERPSRSAAMVRGSKLPWRAGAAPVVPGRFVVVWRDGVSRASTRALAADAGTLPSPAVGNIQTVRVVPGRSEAAAIRRYQRSSLVRFAEPDRLATIFAPPDDSYWNQQWALDNSGQTHHITKYKGLSGNSHHGTADADVDAPEAWAAQTLNTPAVVAVIDTGVDTTHPDLQNSLWVNTVEQGGTVGVDDDANGFTDDLNGWDFFGKDKDPRPDNGLLNSHGTHVSGIVAAERNNATGIGGVCGDCQIMALRIGTASKITLSRELKAIEYAIDNGADVINLSFGSPVWSPAERNAIKQAGNAGILVAAAAGNASLDNDIEFYDFDNGAWGPTYPASYSLDNVISVGASNDRDQYAYVSQCVGEVPLWRCAFTSWGHDSVDVAAPGVDILSTIKTGVNPSNPAYNSDYDVWDGTSMATPMVAGIAGLVLAENPGYTAVDVKNAIMNSVDTPNSLKLLTSYGRITGVGTRSLSGHFTRTQGRVDALAALTGATTNATPQTDGNIDGARSIDLRRTDHLSWPSDANDVYERRLVDGHRYRATLNSLSGHDLDLWIWRPGTKDIFQFTAGCFSRNGRCPALAAASASPHADEAVTFTAHRTGVYFFQANGWYQGGKYALKVRKV
jgi:subtilisin family serine protease